MSVCVWQERSMEMLLRSSLGLYKELVKAENG